MRRIRFCHISITSPSGSAKPPTVYRKTSPAHTSRSIVSEKAEFVNEPRKPPKSGGFFLQFWKTCAIVNMVLPINGKRAAPLCIRRGLHLFLLPPDFRKGGYDIWLHTRNCSSFVFSWSQSSALSSRSATAKRSNRPAQQTSGYFL